MEPLEIPKEEQKSIGMMITLKDDNSIQINSPLINDRMFCFGLLENARRALNKHYDKQDEETIIKPKPDMLGWMRNGKK